MLGCVCVHYGFRLNLKEETDKEMYKWLSGAYGSIEKGYRTALYKDKLFKQPTHCSSEMYMKKYL